MRFFLLILSLLLLFQPASWAMGMPMFAHQQMDYASAHSMMLTTGVATGHCQANNVKTELAGTLTDASNQSDNHMRVGCLAANSTAASLTASAVVAFSPQYIGVTYHVASILFQSRTESPEIRPPHNLRFQG
jgi:hypothetical protein